MQIPYREFLGNTSNSSYGTYRTYLNEDGTVKVVVWKDGTVELTRRQLGLNQDNWSKPQTLWEQKP